MGEHVDRGFLRRSVTRRPCLVLTVLVLAILVLTPLLPKDGLWEGGVGVLYFTALLAAPYFIGGERRLPGLMLTIGLLLVLTRTGQIYMGQGVQGLDRSWVPGIMDGINLAMELLLAAYVVHNAVTARRPREPAAGCILAYVLFGIACGDIYYLLQTHVPGSFAGPDDLPPGRSDMHYLSFITLTTCGYGDIVPRLPFARMLTVLEAIAGVMYTALIIGRILPVIRHRDREEPGPPETAEAGRAEREQD